MFYWAAALLLCSTAMAPNKDWKPDKTKFHLPECARCVDRNLKCLLGPGPVACFECWRSSASCKDWEPDEHVSVGDDDDDDDDVPIGILRLLLEWTLLTFLAVASSTRSILKRRASPVVEVPVKKNKGKERRPPTPDLDVRASSIAGPYTAPAISRSFNTMFGQTGLTADWLSVRSSLKDSIGVMLAERFPIGRDNIIDWFRVGDALGAALDALDSTEVAVGTSDDIQQAEDAEEDETNTV